MALAFPFLRIERLAGVISTRSANSPSGILRLAIMTSMLMIIAIARICFGVYILCVAYREVLNSVFLLFAEVLSDGKHFGCEDD